MNIELNNKTYNVIITYKNNKNMYLRVKDDLNIYITAPLYIKEKEITNFINNNISNITKMIETKERTKKKKENKFLYLGKSYDICYTNEKGINLTNTRAFINKNIDIDKWYKKEALTLFKDRYIECLKNFKETNIIPTLKIRKMTSKWGVCNITKKTITLNLDLIKLDIKYLDYVIFHELCHLVYPNHSKDFWLLVQKYVPDYKKYRNEMKNIL